MITRVFAYSFAQAGTRAMKGKLLGPDDWHYLFRMNSPDDILKYLRGTEYAPVLHSLSDTRSDAGALALSLHDGLFRDYAKLMKAVAPGKASKLLGSLLLRYEAENLKTILRGIWRRIPASGIRPWLYRLGALSRLPVEELMQARQVASAVDLVKSTIFRAPLLHAVPQFKVQGRLFPLEIAADMAAFDHLAATLETLKGFDRKGARALAGELVDWVNLSWLVRFRHFYGLSPEETINYALPGGYRLAVRDLAKLARADDLPQFLDALPDVYREALRHAVDWRQVQPLSRRRLIDELHKSFQKDPFQIGLQLSYLLLKEMEVKSIESLISAVEIGESPARLIDLVGMQVQGDVRV